MKNGKLSTDVYMAKKIIDERRCAGHLCRTLEWQTDCKLFPACVWFWDLIARGYPWTHE